jgi:hypothetical protein
MRWIRAVIISTLMLGLASAAAAQGSRDPRHEIKVRLDPASRALEVEDRFAVKGTVDVVTLGLAPWMTLVAARVDGKAVKVERIEQGLRFTNLGAGPRVIEVLLRGTVPALPQSGARGGSWGPLADTQGAYLPAYSGWMPVEGEALMDYDLTVEVPVPYRVVATGRLVDERLDDEIFSASFASDQPTEPPSIFAGPYIVTERQVDDLRLRTYFHSELAPLTDTYLEASATYIDHYANLIGPYPNEAFHIVSAPIPVGLGFSNLTYVGRRVLPLPFMLTRSLAHEIVHSWWGNGVAVDYAQGNWAEGLTTYLADYALAEERGALAAREMRLGWLQNITALPEDRDMPAVRFTAKHHDAAQVIGYDKVALIFHMLKTELGETTFHDGLRGLWRERRSEVAAWSDLRAAFEAASKRDLAWFFEQWLERPGTPLIELVEATRGGADLDQDLTLRVRQSEPTRRLRLPVLVETADGTRQHAIQLDKPEQSFLLPSDARTMAVRIDPDFQVLRKLLPGESPPIFRDVTLAADTLLVLPSSDEAFDQTAYQLAERLLERGPDIHEGPPRNLMGRPVLVIGTTEDVEGLRTELGSLHHAPDVAATLDGQGTARAWVEHRLDGSPWLFVAADEAAALADILRPLPHYRGRSYVVFDGAKAISKGLWDVRSSPLSHRFGT